MFDEELLTASAFNCKFYNHFEVLKSDFCVFFVKNDLPSVLGLWRQCGGLSPTGVKYTTCKQRENLLRFEDEGESFSKYICFNMNTLSNI